MFDMIRANSRDEQIRNTKYNKVRNAHHSNPFIISHDEKTTDLLPSYDKIKELRKNNKITNEQIDKSVSKIRDRYLGRAYNTEAFKRMTDHTGKTPEYWDNLLKSFKQNKTKRKSR